MNRIAIVLHSNDRLLIEELAGTTETETASGLVRYHPPVKDRDHRTDALRALVRAIETLRAEQSDYGVFEFEDEFGFMDLDDNGGVGYYE